MCAAFNTSTSASAQRMQAANSGWLSRLFGQLPGQCTICQAWPAQSICGACQGEYARFVSRCRLCALQLPAGQTHEPTQPTVCADCLRKPLPAIDACHARVSYQWPWQSSVDAFKFAQQPGWARPLAQLMVQDARLVQNVAACDVLLPMPLHPQRLAERGYNQSLLLARALLDCVANQFALPKDKAVLRHDLLLRTRHTQPQSSLPFAARQRNTRNAFAVPAGHRQALASKHVMLVDDVLTTGASASAAAQALKAAGVAHVAVVVFARTEKP